ncbi:MAG: DUF2911 domain-containing protein [bacterium]
MYKSFFTVIVSITFLLAISSEINYSQQLKTPRLSPQAEVCQSVGLSMVSIKYSRPGVKGRQIWGGLVPYGLTQFQFGSGNPAPWRAGADENTTVNFTDDVKINGNLLKAGTYGFSMIVNEKEDWILIFSNDNQAWGSFFYNQENDALRIKAKPEQSEFTEWLQYGFDQLTNNSVRAFMQWENIRIGFTCEFDVVNITVNSLRNQLTGQSGFNWQSCQQAAMYCYQNNVNLKEAELWMRKSIAMNENESNRNMLGYILMNQSRKVDALAVFKENVDKYPDDWSVYNSYAEALEKFGEHKTAIEYYQKAYEKAPENQRTRIGEKIKELE